MTDQTKPYVVGAAIDLSGTTPQSRAARWAAGLPEMPRPPLGQPPKWVLEEREQTLKDFADAIPAGDALAGIDWAKVKAEANRIAAERRAAIALLPMEGASCVPVLPTAKHIHFGDIMKSMGPGFRFGGDGRAPMSKQPQVDLAKMFPPDGGLGEQKRPFDETLSVADVIRAAADAANPADTPALTPHPFGGFTELTEASCLDETVEAVEADTPCLIRIGDCEIDARPIHIEFHIDNPLTPEVTCGGAALGEMNITGEITCHFIDDVLLAMMMTAPQRSAADAILEALADDREAACDALDIQVAALESNRDWAQSTYDKARAAHRDTGNDLYSIEQLEEAEKALKAAEATLAAAREELVAKEDAFGRCFDDNGCIQWPSDLWAEEEAYAEHLFGPEHDEPLHTGGPNSSWASGLPDLSPLGDDFFRDLPWVLAPDGPYTYQPSVKLPPFAAPLIPFNPEPFMPLAPYVERHWKFARVHPHHKDVEKLCDVILEEFGGPHVSESAADAAIRIMRQQKRDNSELATALIFGSGIGDPSLGLDDLRGPPGPMGATGEPGKSAENESAAIPARKPLAFSVGSVQEIKVSVYLSNGQVRYYFVRDSAKGREHADAIIRTGYRAVHKDNPGELTWWPPSAIVKVVLTGDGITTNYTDEVAGT